jgi:hypothetical protein
MARVTTITLVLLALVASSSSSSLAQSQPGAVEEFDAGSPTSCIKLWDQGIPKSSLNSQLLDQAGAFKGPLQRPLTFFKALKSPVSDEILYIYLPKGITDTFVVFVVDKRQERVLRRSVYWSMYYPCPKPAPRRAA